MFRAVFLDYQSLAPADLSLQKLWDMPEIQWQCFDTSTADQTAERIKNAHIVLSNKVVLDASLLKQNPQIKLIIILATGTNNVDLDAAKSLGISVCNIVAYSTESVVQHTFAMMLALQSRLLDYDQAVKKGDWSKSPFFALLDYPIDEIAGKTLGIIGFGAIGKRIKKVAEAFNMQVIVSESLVPQVVNDGSRIPLSQLYQQADIISIHCPLSEYSLNLIDENALALMKKSAVLINVGRGGIVNEKALAHALKSQTLKAAAIDVLATEPPSEDHILLKNIPNLIITPHTAWASRQARQALVGQLSDICHSFISNNELPNRIV